MYSKDKVIVESPIVKKINDLSRQIILLCAFTHIIYLVLFIKIGVKEMIIFNIFSVICYLVLQSKPFHRTIPILFFVLHFEVTIHAALGTILLGWDYGFSYIIICLITLVYISPFRNKKIPYIYATAEIIIFVILKIYCMENNPIYNSNQITYKYIFLFYNIFTCFAIILFLSRLNNSTNDLAQLVLTETNKNLELKASHDSLTNLLTRRYMQVKLDEAIEKRESKENSFCIAMADIDDFKRFNDKYGHMCGDFVLKNIAQKMVSCLRDTDCVCRWGGEEFLILLDDITLQNAYIVIERIRHSIENSNWVYEGNELKVTITFGISHCSADKTLEYSIQEADNCLYKGKKLGKNCVIIDYK